MTFLGEGDLPREGIAGLEVPKSATVKEWRMNITTPRLRARVCIADLSCRNLGPQLGLVNADSDSKIFVAVSQNSDHNLVFFRSGVCFSSRGPWAYLPVMKKKKHNFVLRSRSAATLFGLATLTSEEHRGSEQLRFMRCGFEVRQSSKTIPASSIRVHRSY